MRPSDALLLEPRPLLVRKALASLLGLQEAIQLQQLHWLLDHFDSRSVELDGRRWLKGELSFWRAQFPWASEATIRRAWDTLKTRGVIERERGREASVFTINYDTLDDIVRSAQSDRSHRSDRADGTDQIDRSSRKEEGTEEREEQQLAATSAAGDQLFAVPADPGPSSPAPAPAKPADPAEADIERVWAHYVQVFGDRLRIKELTDPRRRALKKAHKAVGGDVDVMIQAINGLQSYRKANPGGSKDVSLDAVFSTGPHESRSLTDKIEWWASQADSGNRGGSDNLAEHPAAIRDKVKRYRLLVVEMHQSPHLSGVRERGRGAMEWLKNQAHEEPIIENDQVIGWRRIEA